VNVFSDTTTVLIIDDSLTVRQSLRAMLSNVGVTRSETAANAADGLMRLQKRSFDVVLCDYNLGEGMNGQEMLEQLRSTGSYPLTSVWIMITGERSYERVVAAAEVAPDDYILKPFSSQALFDRMQSAFTRKRFLKPAHLHLMNGREDLAIATMDELVGKAANPVQKLDVLRLLAETHLALEHYQEASKCYSDILDLRVIPWAKMGLARIFKAQDKVEESSELLNEIIREAPHYTDAYDTLAHNLARCGQFAESLDVLEKAVALSPRNFRRLCLTGESALNAGDPAKAALYLEKAVRIGRNNSAFGPDVLIDLLQAHSEAGNAEKMDQVANELSGMLKGEHNVFLLHVCRAMTLLGRKSWMDAQESLKQAAALLLQKQLSWRSGVRFLEAVARLPDDIDGYKGYDWVKQLALRLVRTHQDVEQLTAMAKKSIGLIRAVHDAYGFLQNTNDEAVSLTKDKKKDAAAKLLYDSASVTLNDRLGMNACALLLQLADDTSISLAQALLDWLPAEHERVHGLVATLQKLRHAANQQEILPD